MHYGACSIVAELTATPTVEDWAERYITSTSLEFKKSPPPPPESWAATATRKPAPRPGRPVELMVSQHGTRTPKGDALRERHCRARLLHTFWHHELQAAELMCWALLRFSQSEPAFRRGLLTICLDEIRHMSLYERQLQRLGYAIGAFPVRDWFWERVPTCTSPVAFVALMGMGLEGANLDHAADYAEQFAAAGDLDAAALQHEIGRDECHHVRFATFWFERWKERISFSAWQASLPPPLSPLIMRGRMPNRAARLSAGMPPEFVDALCSFRAE